MKFNYVFKQLYSPAISDQGIKKHCRRITKHRPTRIQLDIPMPSVVETIRRSSAKYSEGPVKQRNVLAKKKTNDGHVWRVKRDWSQIRLLFLHLL